MDELLVGLRAILFVLSHGEFNVSELTQILGQSQPRVSRHLKLMVEAGMVSRHKEGNWVLFRLREEGLGGTLSRAIVDMLPAHDATLARDLARLETIRTQRAELAASYFSSNAANWQKLRSLHIREEDVEGAMQAILGKARVTPLVCSVALTESRPSASIRAAICSPSPGRILKKRRCAMPRSGKEKSMPCPLPMVRLISSSFTRFCTTLTTPDRPCSRRAAYCIPAVACSWSTRRRRGRPR